ncbi:MAG: hypothetical protein CMC02_03690 [Flavobacteriaceae bacterium]|nr:hypothetical protein [Flavobacteriaceae bacterium]
MISSVRQWPITFKFQNLKYSNFDFKCWKAQLLKPHLFRLVLNNILIFGVNLLKREVWKM